VGVGERWAKNDSVTQALDDVPAGAPRIVFMHDPDSYAKIPAGEAPLAISGHTHGLQVGIPLVTDYIGRHWFSDEGCSVEGWDHGCGKPGNNMYISRGIGFSIIPGRIHAMPEVTIFTLTRAKEPVIVAKEPQAAK